MTSSVNLTEKYQVMPGMPPEQFEALKADIAERGVLVPIDVDEQGHILDGHHRYQACVELGLVDFPTIVRPGLSEEERRIFARKNNMLRRHLSRKQARELIGEQLKDTPSWANNRIAHVLGVDSKTVQSVRHALEITSEIPKFDKLIGSDGKARPVKQNRLAAIMASNTDDLSRILDRIKQGASVEELQGFLSEQGFESLCMIHSEDYNPFAGCDEDGERDWHLWLLWMIQSGAEPNGVTSHVGWILRKQFKTPDEWMGEKGIRWRGRIGFKRPKFSKKALRSWAAFFAEHDGKSLSDIAALIDKEAGP